MSKTEPNSVPPESKYSFLKSARFWIGFGAITLFLWRQYFPVQAYSFFLDFANWFSSWVIFGESWWFNGPRNFVSGIIIDQLDGFLLGVFVSTTLTILFKPIRWATTGLIRLFR